MATPESIAVRKAEALIRLDKAATTLAKSAGVDKPDLVLKSGYEPDYSAMLQIETMAGWLESIADTKSKKSAKADDDDAALAEAEATDLAVEAATAEAEATRLAEAKTDDVDVKGAKSTGNASTKARK